MPEHVRSPHKQLQKAGGKEEGRESQQVDLDYLNSHTLPTLWT